jgi:iron complex transport system ATP-binding protein
MIQVKDINFGYHDDLVIRELSFSIEAGEFVGIIGPNGAGKSTLLKLLDRILRPRHGFIKLDGKLLDHFNRKELARLIGFVQQDFSSAFNFSALDIVLMGRFPYQKPFAFDSSEDIEIARRVMNLTNCDYLRHREFMTLSGGERQRVVLASALAQEPKILLLDEPTNALDLKHQLHFYEILKKLNHEQGITILTVTHDINLAAQFCQRIMVMKNGEILADGITTEVLNKTTLQNVYDTPLEIIQHPNSRLPVILPELRNRS